MKHFTKLSYQRPSWTRTPFSGSKEESSALPHCNYITSTIQVTFQIQAITVLANSNCSFSSLQ